MSGYDIEGVRRWALAMTTIEERREIAAKLVDPFGRMEVVNADDEWRM